MPDLYSDFVFGQVTATVNAGDTTATLDDVSTFPSNTLLGKADFYVTFDSGLTHPNSFEIVKVTAVNTSSKTITFTPSSAGHAIGTMVKGTLTAGMLSRLRAGSSGTAVPSQDNTIYNDGDRFWLTTTNTLYVYNSSTGFVQAGGSSRATATATTSSLANNAKDSTTNITLSKAYKLYSIQTSVPARVTLYTNAAARTADVTRAMGVDPTSTAGVVLDYNVLLGGTTYSLSPVVEGVNLESSPNTTIPMSVTNLSGSTSTVTVTLVWLKQE